MNKVFIDNYKKLLTTEQLAEFNAKSIVEQEAFIRVLTAGEMYGEVGSINTISTKREVDIGLDKQEK